MSRWTYSVAERYNARTVPLESANIAMPQQPQAPVGSFQAGRSASNVLPSSCDSAIHTCLPASPSAAPGAFPCHATYTLPAESAAVQRENMRAFHFIGITLEI